MGCEWGYALQIQLRPKSSTTEKEKEMKQHNAVALTVLPREDRGPEQNTKALATLKPAQVSIGKIGKSRLVDPADLAKAREGVAELSKELLDHYHAIGQFLADPENYAWTASNIEEDLAMLRDAILATGSADPKASPLARRTREATLKTVGASMLGISDEMPGFPRTLLERPISPTTLSQSACFAR